MTKEEIKQTYNMLDIVRRYGLEPDRSGFIHCPFHPGDKGASLKLYGDNFYCYGCGASGDIFKFVMLMDGVSFKDAFISLGGTYSKPETRTDARHRARDIALARQKREREEEDISRKKREILEQSEEWYYLESFSHAYEPFSDAWCRCIDGYVKAMCKYDSLWEEVRQKRQK